MGFITNVEEEFSDSQHEALVESLLILTNAFIAATVPVGMSSRSINRRNY